MHNDSRPFSDSPFRIAIVGGGPGGLTLARILHTRGIATTVYELDDHPLVRPQGGTLDLHADGGQMALQRAGLVEGFLSIARYEDQGARLLDRDARILFEEPEGLPGERDRPEVDRTLLRTLLIGSLPPGIIQWGRRLRTVKPLDDGPYRLDFTDGSHEDYDFIVGSDGAWSKVRPLVSDAVPEYSGVTFVETGFDHADTDHPQIARLVGRGKMFALGESKGILSQRNGNSHIRAYFAFRVAENWIHECGIDFASAEKTRAGLLARFDGWAPGLRAFVEDSDNWFVPRALYALPSGHSWPSRPGVTLLGDAAHLMSPFGGFGANYAMLDAAELAEAIEHGLKSGDRAIFDTTIADYEIRMCERAAPAAAAALEGLHGAFSEDAFAHVFDHLGNGKVHQEA